MLVMTHKSGDTIYIGDDVKIEILECKGGRVKIGYTADGKTILRDKVKDREQPDVQDD